MKRLRYIEIPRSQVPGELLDPAEKLRNLVQKDLGLEPTKIRWLCRADQDEYERARAAGTFATSKINPAYGWVDPAIRDRSEFFFIYGSPLKIIAHEMRHLYQLKNGKPTTEDDAYAYQECAWRRFRSECQRANARAVL